MEDFPQSLASKLKAKGPQTNNVMNILVEDREEDPTVDVITKSGLKANEEVGKYVPVIEIRKARGPPPPFNPQ